MLQCLLQTVSRVLGGVDTRFSQGDTPGLILGLTGDVQWQNELNASFSNTSDVTSIFHSHMVRPLGLPLSPV